MSVFLSWAMMLIKQPNYVCFWFETNPILMEIYYERKRKLCGFVCEFGNTSWQFWITTEMIALVEFFEASLLNIYVLKNLGYFLNLKTNPIWKSFSTSCLVLCHSAQSLPLNLTAFPSIRSIFPTGHNWLKVLNPWKLKPSGRN